MAQLETTTGPDAHVALNDDPSFLKMAAAWALPLIDQLRTATPLEPADGLGASGAASR